MRKALLCCCVWLGTTVALQADPVTFQVDMSVRAAEGAFDPASDSVEAHGSFDAWGAGFQLEDPDGDQRYQGTIDLPPGDIQYKFVFVKGVVEFWETRDNRAATLPGGATTLPMVFFDDDTLVSLPAPVTFKVNMSVRAAEGLFDPAADTVEARGSFNGWGGGFELSDADGDKIYEGTTDVAPGNIQYKFVYVKEGVVSWETRDDRAATIADGGGTLETVYFDDDSEVSVLGPVTFRVNMSVKAAEGLFDPTVDTVEARGSFNGWSSGFELTDTDGDKTYEGTTDVAPGNVEYKFVYVKDGTVNWEGRANRTTVIPAGGTQLPVVYFDDDEVVSVAIQAEIQFQVDMNVQLAAGNFDPAADEVWVRGGKVGWGAPPGGFQLAPDPARPGVYMGTLMNDVFEPAFTLFSGENFEYKYTIWRPGTSATVWEDGGNKVLVFDGSEPDSDSDGYKEKVLGLVYFNGVSFNDVLRADTLVTFRVDMNGAQRTDGTPFDPATESVYLNGSWVPWWSWGSSPVEYAMRDDGLEGDEAEGDKIYTLRVQYRQGAPRKLVYKFGIESLDNEAAVGTNHERYINQDGAFVLPVEKFGTMTVEPGPSLGTLTVAFKSSGTGPLVVLTWNGGAGTKVQKTSGLGSGSWTDVPGTDGVSTIELPASGMAEFYRLARP